MNATLIAAGLSRAADAMLTMEPEPEVKLPPVDHAMNAACAQRFPEPADAPLVSDDEIAYWESLADELEAERNPVKVRKMKRHW